jgi:pyruvate/2-oxoglutarate/acetoin dehydrogenase E1 component
MHVPGMRVVAPSTPYDAKGCLIQSIRDDNPVIFVEHRMIHFQRGHVPEEAYTVPFGKARVLAEGDDVTLVGISYMAVECMRARKHLADAGVSAEVVDPVCLSPLDVETIVESVKKTGRLVIVDTDWTACGASAEILALVVERLQEVRHIRVQRMGYAPVTCPTTKNLENLFYPNPERIASAAYHMVHDDREHWMPDGAEAPEIIEFKGPF